MTNIICKKTMDIGMFPFMAYFNDKTSDEHDNI